ncbi:hypothetical protein Amet_1934 [Alkaliphilus metalliredigens QYMF]|nr:hypothetical protein [Alkaliphilus metalliredigens]ABR46624.1 hypothetical protein Amet_0396 [Alkaliphilus metalliredigens QYMF]ABR48097.1 hypothetical protein Amet_1934 [Alkaliphilus metalliredigens QYMF]
MAKQMISIKIDIEFDIEDMKKSLKERGILPNKANTDRMVKMIRSGRFLMNKGFLAGQPMDKETLLMYGFTFENE